MQIVKPGTKIDFVGKRYIAGMLSGLMVVASLLIFFFVGPNWGIDFTGGTEVTLDFAEDNPVTNLVSSHFRLTPNNYFDENPSLDLGQTDRYKSGQKVEQIPPGECSLGL